MASSLAGKRIVVPESRELDLFARMLEEEGAETLRCPMVTILDLDDDAPAVSWLKRLAGGEFTDLILLTGEGLRRLLGVAKRAGIEAPVVAALGRLRTVTRGPKPVRALRDIGLKPGLAAADPTTEGIIATLSAENLHGRKFGVQLYPGNPNDRLMDFLRGAGAEAAPVLPYRYASDAESARVEAIIKELAAGKIDAIAFTSSPQVKRLVDVARERGLESELRQGLKRTRIAAVGPVVTAALEAIGAKVEIAPEDSFHLKPLVKALGMAFAAKG